MKCPQCRSDNPDTQSFCGNCGTQLGRSKETPEVTKTIQTPSPRFAEGTSLTGRYRILGEIGKGGMGEVYLAEDTSLQRRVAVKVLPQAVALDQEMLARFEREARLLASLNHPNIATIHGLEESDGLRFLVMELVEGENLAERIQRGPLSLDEVLKIAQQITEGMESAHEKGIIHRDLKPANIKVSKDGMVKILDFGLAKAFENAASGEERVDPMKSPTITVGSSGSGVILGTAAYMSPEQARGKTLDKRTDIWSFGCVLYEMLSGRKAFKGETVSDFIAAILKNEPDWSVLPLRTPPGIRTLLRRCLRKDPHQRLHDIADARIDIQDVLAGPDDEIEPAAAAASSRWRILFWAAAGLAAILCFLLLWNPRRTDPSGSHPVSRFQINLVQGEFLDNEIGSSVALSPDGTQLVYAAVKEETTQLYIRPIREFESRPIPGTEGAHGPFFSPDGNWIAFHGGGKLKKVLLQGGTPQNICDTQSGKGGTWTRDGTIYFTDTNRGGILRVPAAGGSPELLASGLRMVEEGSFEHTYLWPQMLPGEKDLLYTIWNNTEDMQVVVYSLKSGDRKRLVERGSHARYLPGGHLIYAWAGDLMAVPFDLETLEPTGPPELIFEGVQRGEWGLAHFDISENGSLVFVPGYSKPWQNRLVWTDLGGRIEILSYPSGLYQSPRLSPDGKQLVVARQDNVPNMWIYGLERGTSRRLTDEQGSEWWAIWTPDGRDIIFNSTRTGKPTALLLRKPADGSRPEELFAEGEYHQQPQSLSADGNFLLLTEGLNPETGLDIWLLDLTNKGRPEPFLHAAYNEIQPRFSPDGRWVAYAADESDRLEVYVRPFPGPGDIIPISTEGGMEPVWSPEGDVLYYRDISGRRVMSVSFIAEPELRVGKPKLLFEGKYFPGSIWGGNYDLSPDGKRFIMITDEGQSSESTQINIILNF